jgi:hypothetical protein
VPAADEVPSISVALHRFASSLRPAEPRAPVGDPAGAFRFSRQPAGALCQGRSPGDRRDRRISPSLATGPTSPRGMRFRTVLSGPSGGGRSGAPRLSGRLPGGRREAGFPSRLADRRSTPPARPPARGGRRTRRVAASGPALRLGARATRQPDSQTARQPDSQTAGQPGSRTARQPDGQTARRPDGQTARQTTPQQRAPPSGGTDGPVVVHG